VILLNKRGSRDRNNHQGKERPRKVNSLVDSHDFASPP